MSPLISPKSFRASQIIHGNLWTISPPVFVWDIKIYGNTDFGREQLTHRLHKFFETFKYLYIYLKYEV